MSAGAGLRLAVTTLTVLPLRAGRVDRAAARWAMMLAPLVGLALAAVLAGLLWGMREVGFPPLVAAAVTVTAGVLLTRGLHLDGLADTMDGFGSYKTGNTALEIMKKSDIGPFGVAAIALVLLIQTAVLAAAPGAAVVVAWTAGRVAITLACRDGIPAARPDGLGALVAGTVGRTTAWAIAIVVVLASAPAIPGRPAQAPVAVAVALAAVALLLRRAVRRFGGITGDVLGACAEIGTTVALAGLSLR
ncbi:adenosylcobinamide-GDP ribazoletransferase [Actinoplanes sp. CA-030573]|uniref:adenosylcobinamide-GDP ribazoletransferase n=1 Tax=Actinoplanes sp. CA-030573 TaxID=3239898 RepID=UPI003D8E8F6C